MEREDILELGRVLYEYDPTPDIPALICEGWDQQWHGIGSLVPRRSI